MVTARIDHGTARGYRQHVRLKVPTGGGCGCREAINEENKTRAAAKKGATPSQQTWNRGHVGTPTEPRHVPTGRDCTTPGCGELACRPRPAARMVLVEWLGSREPARWYCPGACAAYGRALAEVRAIGEGRA